ncbi:MAG: hypothetical protein MH321_08405 [Leptospiraceae bacterium]|nr:hypothetical protein [Leptospiraceae bacterium]
MISIKLQKVFLFFFFSLFIFSCGVDDGEREPVTPQDEYTLEAPGIWSGLEESHLPIVLVTRKGRGEQKIAIRVQDTTNFSLNHYIEKIGIMDENKMDIAVKIFPDRTVYIDEPIDASFELSSLPESPKIKAYVKCNLHDLWTSPVYPQKY